MDNISVSDQISSLFAQWWTERLGSCQWWCIRIYRARGQHRREPDRFSCHFGFHQRCSKLVGRHGWIPRSDISGVYNPDSLTVHYFLSQKTTQYIKKLKFLRPPPLIPQIICSYVFMPVAFMMGIPYDESFIVAELIGTKLFLNEFIAYEKLSELKNNRLNGLLESGPNRNWISVSVSSNIPWIYC